MYRLLRPILFLLPAEIAHHVTLGLLGFVHKLRLLGLFFTVSKSDQPVQVMGLNFPNPVGLAAGLDKDGKYVEALSALGFGFIEIGTVTPKPQPGNPKPRMFRIEPAEAIINRMGFNNEGVDALVERISALRTKGFEGIIGINIGKNKDTPENQAVSDYITCLKKVYPWASYVTVNISSPNTPGLRKLQYGEALGSLLAALKQAQKTLEQEHQRYVPIALKIAPDMTAKEVREIAGAVFKHKIDALIATNTTLSREEVQGYKTAHEAGGLSGKPVQQQSTDVLRAFHEILGDSTPIIGVGGIVNGDDAREKREAGASLVQLYSGLIYRGPVLIKDCLELIK